MKKILLVGAGNRAMIYARYALEYPEKMRIVGVVDPSTKRRERAQRLYDLSDDVCYESIDEVLAQPKVADAVINGTMDDLHVETSIPFLKQGYHLLLEKPIGVSMAEINELLAVAEEYDSQVMICHVLRYTPFYRKIKELVADDTIGDIYNIQATEHVRLDHMITSYVKGKWNNTEESGASMLLAKACHDLDLIAWLNEKSVPKKVMSYGNDFVFNRANKPDACTEEGWYCEHCQKSIYSPRKMYIEHPDRWAQYVWTEFENQEEVTVAEKIRSMEEGNPYGQCVWSTDKNIVDQQTVMIEFADQSLATFNMVGGTPKSQRRIHLIGTMGEIIGTFEDNELLVRRFDSDTKADYQEEIIQTAETSDQIGAFGGHGGGDGLLIADFIDYLKNPSAPSLTRTVLKDSIISHELAFLADESMETNQQVLYR